MSAILRNYLLTATGWTGGQYSIFRALLGVHLLITSILQHTQLSSMGNVVFGIIAITGAFLSVLLILGYLDHLAAILLAVLWAIRFGVIPGGPTEAEPLLVFLLLAHLEMPRSPLGSLHYAPPMADTPWRMPAPVHGLISIIGCGYYTTIGLAGLFHLNYSIVLALLLVSPLSLVTRYQRNVWLLQLMAITLFLLQHGQWAIPLLPFHFFMFDPRWVPSTRPTAPEKVFFDGGCGLCHRTILLALVEDEDGSRFRFSPIGSPAFNEALSAEQRVGLPDSVVVVTDRGELLTKSRAILHILGRLGGSWRVVSAVLGIIPLGVADFFYDGIALFRKWIFPVPNVSCPLVPGYWSERFMVG